jgi:putative ABC transport system ATP-binding protein
MTGIVIEAVNVVKVLGHGASRIRALDHVSLDLSRGELVLLMGPSGCGKTTLLSVLGCMLAPTHGLVRLLGQPAARLDAEQLARLRREHIGFVFQSYHLFPTLSALDNVRLALDIRGAPAKDSSIKARSALSIVQVSHKAEHYPHELSIGEQQRVAIARSIVSGASVVLADEPTAALDSADGYTIMTVLSRLARDFDRGVLVVTHDPRIVPFADRIIQMEDGRIVGEERGARHWHAGAPLMRGSPRH